MAGGAHQTVAAFDLLEETLMSEERSWLSLPLSEQSATPDRQGLWQCPEELLQDLGVSLFLLLRSPPPAPWGASEQSRLLPPFSLRAHPVGWAAAVGPEPGCVAGAGACFVLGASVSFPLGSIRQTVYCKRDPGL